MVAAAAPSARALSEGSDLRIVEVSKHFPTPDNPQGRTQALDRVSLSVGAAALVSLIGPSGCGKSTLLRLIAGLNVPDAGGLWVGAQPITAPSAERGLVLQDPTLFPLL